MDQDATNHILLDGTRHDYVTSRTQMNPVSPFIIQMEV
jgi:hypothetical protein